MKSAKTNNNSEYGYRCEYCEGTVRPKKVEREAFKHKKGFIILEDVVIGVCDACGSRYYSADIIHAVHDIATGTKPFERTEEIPVAHLSAS
jgi:YgiT-type zinc finger domain-containing protein